MTETTDARKMSKDSWVWLGVTLAAFAVCTFVPPRIKSDKWRKAIYWVLLIPISLVLIFYVYPAGIEFFKRLAVGSS